MADNHDPACAAEDDVRIAQRVMDEGDLRHAAFHVAGAINVAPQDANALGLAGELLRRSADPFSLAPIKRDENFSGTLAPRARFLQQRGMHAEASPLIAEGWPGTLRRRALLSLLRGPIDWINGAAAVVLCDRPEEQSADAHAYGKPIP